MDLAKKTEDRHGAFTAIKKTSRHDFGFPHISMTYRPKQLRILLFFQFITKHTCILC